MDWPQVRVFISSIDGEASVLGQELPTASEIIPTVGIPFPGETTRSLLILGGSKSGKSTFAENLAEIARAHFASPVYYLATLQAGSDSENLSRINHHRKQRQGKGFRTLEQATCLSAVAYRLVPDSIFIVECLGTWLANELFDPQLAVRREALWEKSGLRGSYTSWSNHTLHEAARHLSALYLQDLAVLRAHSRLLILVSNDVFSDILSYDKGTELWRHVLADLHNQLNDWEGHHVLEVSAGLPFLWSGHSSF